MKSNKIHSKKSSTDIYKLGIIRYSDALVWPIKPKINISIVTTYKCSLGCPYCLQNKEKKINKLLSLKLFEKLLNKMFLEFKKENILNYKFAFSILGGEISELPLKYNLDLLDIIIDKIEKYKLDVEITWLSNFVQDNEYYLSIYNYLIKRNVLEIIDFEFLFSIHSQFIKNKSNEFIQNKLKSLFKSKNTITQNTCIKIFGKNNAQKYIKTLLPFKPSFEIGDLNYLSYKKKFNNELNNLRVVKCYNYNYDINPFGEIINRCGRNMTYFNFKANDLKKCNKMCPVGDVEFNTYKELI